MSYKFVMTMELAFMAGARGIYRGVLTYGSEFAFCIWCMKSGVIPRIIPYKHTLSLMYSSGQNEQGYEFDSRQCLDKMCRRRVEFEADYSRCSLSERHLLRDDKLSSNTNRQ